MEPARLDPDLALGVRQLEQAQFGEAIRILERVVERLKGDWTRSKELAEAHRYLGMAHVGLGDEMLMRMRFPLR